MTVITSILFLANHKGSHNSYCWLLESLREGKLLKSSGCFKLHVSGCIEGAEGSLYAQSFVPQAFAEESGIPFLETSAENAINVEQVFQTMDAETTTGLVKFRTFGLVAAIICHI